MKITKKLTIQEFPGLSLFRSFCRLPELVPFLLTNCCTLFIAWFTTICSWWEWPNLLLWQFRLNLILQFRCIEVCWNIYLVHRISYIAAICMDCGCETVWYKLYHIMFEELTLRLGRPDNIRFIGKWVLPFDPNVVFIVTLDVIFLDGLPLVRFCALLTPHQVNWTEFLEKKNVTCK